MSKSIKDELLAKGKQKQVKKLVAVRLPNDLYKEILNLSKQTKASMSDVIILALKKGLDSGG